MAQFLRDQRLSNITVKEDLIVQLVEVFATRASTLAGTNPDGEETNKPFLVFTIRFDGRGYRLFSVDQLLRYFRRAKEVERLIITIETGSSLRSNRAVGEHLEVRLDKYDQNLCYLSVTADDSDPPVLG